MHHIKIRNRKIELIPLVIGDLLSRKEEGELGTSNKVPGSERTFLTTPGSLT